MTTEYVRYSLARDKCILRVGWDSHDGHLKGFRLSSFYQEVVLFPQFVNETRHYDLIAVRRATSL